LARKKQSARPKLNPATKIAAAKRAIIISAAPAKAGPGKRDSLIRRVLKVLGPGLVTGAADDDPSGSDPKIIGKRHLPVYLKIVGWTATLIMALASIAMFLTSGK
jgi:Mn2+/Fe2+ NRAMP family transporter